MPLCNPGLSRTARILYPLVRRHGHSRFECCGPALRRASIATRCENGPLWLPPMPYSLAGNIPCGCVGLQAPVRKRFGYTANSHHNVRASVCHLLFWRRPFTVTGLVALIIVDPLKRLTWRSSAHIRKEVFERIEPALADPNRPASIPFECFMVWIGAPFLHRAPAIPFATHSPRLAGVSMCSIRLSHESGALDPGCHVIENVSCWNWHAAIILPETII